MLAISFITGAASGARWSWGVVSLSLLLIAGYSSRLPLLAWLRHKRRDAIPWLAGYSLTVVLAALTILSHPQFQMLAICLILSGILFGLSLWFASQRLQRTVVGEFIGVAGLTLTAPIAYYSAVGNSIQRAVLLWLLNALFFGSSIFYVKMRLEQHRAERRAGGEHSISYRTHNAVYHAILVILLLLLWRVGWISFLAVFAFSPLLMRCWIQLRRVKLTVRQLGFSELAMSIGYALWLILFL